MNTIWIELNISVWVGISDSIYWAERSTGDFQNFGLFFPIGMVTNGDEISGYFVHGGQIFGQFFQLGGGSIGSCDILPRVLLYSTYLNAQQTVSE